MIDRFLSHNRVFTHAQIRDVLLRETPRSQAAVDACVRRLCLGGRIGRIRRELYFTIPPGETADSCYVDFGLAASLVAPDTVLSHVTALEYHTGTDIPSGDRVCFLTRSKIRPTTFRGIRLCPCRSPIDLVRTGWQDFQIETVYFWGAQQVRVTGPERSLVDTLSAIRRSGGWKVVWPLLDTMATTAGFNIARCATYLRWLNNPAVTTRTGWFLARHETHLHASPWDHSLFHEHRPAQPRYLIPGERGGTLDARWNLIVPREVAD